MASDKPPNVLFIMADQFRWDCVGANGNALIRTPHLDRLAEDGVTFENSFTNAISCVPSRACLMTGQYAHIHGVGAPGGGRGIDPNTPLMPGRFARAGYSSIGVGKMHLVPIQRVGGFDRRVFIESKYANMGLEDEYRRVLIEKGLIYKDVGPHHPDFYSEKRSLATTDIPPEYYIDAYVGRRGVETLHLVIDEDTV